MLINYGALEAGVRWAARGGRWLRALALCNIGAPQMEIAVRAQMASHLEDEGKVNFNSLICNLISNHYSIIAEQIL